MRSGSGRKQKLMTHNVVLQDSFLQHFFKSVIGPDFYLTGGTALARFYFHHRESLDLDLFTHEQDLDFDIVNRTILSISQSLRLQITSQVTTDTFLQYIFTDEAQTLLKVDIVKDIPVRFGAITLHDIIRLDSLENIGSNKVLAVFGRTDAKDFIDLYWIIDQSALTFDTLFKLAKQKDLGLSELYLAYALQKAENITRFPAMLQPLPWSEIVSYYRQLAQSLMLRIKPKE